MGYGVSATRVVIGYRQGRLLRFLIPHEPDSFNNISYFVIIALGYIYFFYFAFVLRFRNFLKNTRRF